VNDRVTDTANINLSHVRRRSRRRDNPLWWLLSLLLHTGIVVIMVALTPLRHVVMPEPRPTKSTSSMSGDRVEKLAARIQELRLNELLALVRELDYVREETETVRDDRTEDWSEYREHQAATAEDELAEMLAAVDKLQEEAGEKQADAREKLQRADSATDDSLADIAEKASETFKNAIAAAAASQVEAQRAQMQAENMLDKAAGRAAMVGMADAAAVLRAAHQAQKDARTSQAAAERARVAELGAHDRALKLLGEVKLREARVADGERRVAEHQTRVAETERLLASVKEALDAHTGGGGDANDKTGRDLRGQQNKAENSLRNDKYQLGRAERDLPKLQKELQRKQDESLRFREEMRMHEKWAPAAQRQTMVLQVEAQRIAREARAAVARDKPEVIPEVEPAAVAEPARAPRFSQLDLADLYDAAKSIEATVAETYRDTRATELAMLRGIPVADAKALTDVAAPVRPTLDANLLRSTARTGAALERHKAEVAKAVVETKGMLAASNALLDAIRPSLEDADDEGFTVAMVEERSQALDAIEAAASENESEPARDLTALMDADAEPAPPKPGRGRPRTDREAPEDQRLVHPQLSSKTAHVHPGRIVSPGGKQSHWMIVDSWYVIGPFPNPDRSNIDRKFPPETVVDLDATYEGKDGRPIGWVFEQATGPIIEPMSTEPYGIWYAYTEVRFDGPRDAWVAVGSDDKSKIWVNDQLVWESVPWLKAWKINEGYRRIRFREGRNRILYRIENGHGGMGWSFIIHTGA